MKVYNLSISNTFTSNNLIQVLDNTNQARVKYFVNWGQFFKYEDYGKTCKIKVILYTKKSANLDSDANLGLLCATLPSNYNNFVNGLPLGLVTAYNATTLQYQFQGAFATGSNAVLTNSTTTIQLPNGTQILGYNVPANTIVTGQTAANTYTTNATIGTGITAEAMTGLFTNNCIYCDTTLTEGVQGLIPSQAAELTLNFMKMDGTTFMSNVTDYICQIKFEIQDDDDGDSSSDN